MVFTQSVNKVAITLAKAIARDGEGASKLIEVQVTGAPSLDLAKQVARSITVSPLIKTAIYGESPNWGRLLARLGAEQVAATILETTAIIFQQQCVFANNQPMETDPQLLRDAMKSDAIHIHIALNSGAESAVAWGCDLSVRNT